MTTDARIYILNINQVAATYLTFLYNFIQWNKITHPNHAHYVNMVRNAFSESVSQVLLVANLEPLDFQLELDTLPNFEMFYGIPELQYDNQSGRPLFINNFKHFAASLYMELHQHVQVPFGEKIVYLPITINPFELVIEVKHDSTSHW